MSMLHTHTDDVARQLAHNATPRELGGIVDRFRSQNSKPARKLDELTGTDSATISARTYVIYLDELHTRAGRENIARSMTTEDLGDMLPDFEQVAALCGIRPEQARINKQIVIDELHRRALAEDQHRRNTETGWYGRSHIPS